MLENLLREPIARFMTTNIKSASPHDTIEKSALTLLKSSFRRLPILNSEHRLLGVVNSNDILTIMYRKLIINQSDIPHLLRTRLSAHMWVHYSVLSPDTPLINAVRTLHRKCIGCIAILRDTRLVGIFTERDLTRVAAQQDFGQRVVEYMTREFFHQPKKKPASWTQ
jgi:CBS domain-containing protein